MKKLPLFAMIALVSVPAHAQNAVSFQINGRTVHLGLSNKCDGERCISISTDRNGGGEKIDGSKIRGILSDLMSQRNGVKADREDEPSTEAAQEAPAAPATIAKDPVVAMAPPAPSSEPSSHAIPQPDVAQPAPRQETAKLEPAVPAAETPQPRAVSPSVAPRAEVSNSPVGIWRTQNKEGRVHIVPCGDNYCGYVVDAQTNRDGAKVLIDMKSVNGKNWSGRVHDPKGGGTYDATMALKGSDALAIRGCAFGGMICRGQTWSRS